MPSFDSMVQNYHTASFGGVALLEEGDFFLPGAEPRMSKAAVMDTPECAGLDSGEIYSRGNTKWKISVQRVKWFEGTYPIYTEGEDPVVLYATPEEHAQKWLTGHLNSLSEAVGTASWGGKTFAKAMCVPEGTTDGPFAIVTYEITASELA